jgi:hemolysin D
MRHNKPALPIKLRATNQPAVVRRRPRQPITDLTALPVPRDDRVAGDRDFLPAALEIIETPPLFRQTLLAYGLCGLILMAILWSIFAYLTTYAVATGEIRAVGETKVVEPVEKGQVSTIRAKEGDRVKKGDALVELNPTDALSARTIINDKLVSLRAEMARRRVEIDTARGEPIDTKPAIVWDADIPQKIREREEGMLQADISRLAATLSDLMAQRKAKETARDGFSTSIASENALITARSEHVGMHQQLEVKGWDSRARVLEALEPLKEEQVALSALQGDFADAVATIPVFDSEIVKAREVFVADDTQKLAAADRQVDDLAQQLTKADQALANMTLRAPIAGIVQASAVTTIGQVVSPGQQLMQVVPVDGPIEIVAYVLNTDIGFVREGQPAVIKIDTFAYTRYGTIAGTVTRVAGDAISGDEALRQQKNASTLASRGPESNTTAAQQTRDLVFPVVVTPSKSTIEVDGKNVALSPGMSVVVEITTGQHRAISYIMYPLVRGAPQSRPN